jgi:hypothetical protein
MRGNGTLILTGGELLFKQWVVNEEFRIPLKSIQSIETPRSFLGKTQGIQLLKVSYLNESGAPGLDYPGLVRLLELEPIPQLEGLALSDVGLVVALANRGRAGLSCR